MMTLMTAETEEKMQLDPPTHMPRLTCRVHKNQETISIWGRFARVTHFT